MFYKFDINMFFTFFDMSLCFSFCFCRNLVIGNSKTKKLYQGVTLGPSTLMLEVMIRLFTNFTIFFSLLSLFVLPYIHHFNIPLLSFFNHVTEPL